VQAAGGAALIGRTGQDGGAGHSRAGGDDAQPSGARPHDGEVSGGEVIGASPRSVVSAGASADSEVTGASSRSSVSAGASAGGEVTGGEVTGAPLPVGRRRIGLLVAVAALVLTADLVSKVAVVATLSERSPVRLLGGLVYLVQARNAGAAFSFAQGATVLFSAVAALVIVIILRSASQLRSLPWAISLGLILGGAAGNLADRLFRSPGPMRGRVVDWISVLDPAGRVWPIFNLADSCIVVGGVLAVLLAFAGVEMTGSRSRQRP
jgi:signal peptidase II